MEEYEIEILQVVPHEDYTVSVYFSDGKIVSYDVKPFLETGVFVQLKDISVFMNSCTILNDTLAWDISGKRDASNCIDIAPETLYALPHCEEKSEVA